MSEDSDRVFPWLEGDEKVFAKSTGNRLNVDIAFEHDLYFYAYGYRRSAEMLFERLSEGHYADSQYFALAFLWRQAIELQLKSLITGLDELDGVIRWQGPPRKYRPDKHAPLAPPIGGHDLLALWSDLEPRLKEIFAGAPEQARVRRVIEEFHRVDPTAEDFRYPTKIKDGSQTLKSLPRNLSIAELHDVLSGLMNVLEAAGNEVQSRLDYTREGLALEAERER